MRSGRRTLATGGTRSCSPASFPIRLNLAKRCCISAKLPVSSFPVIAIPSRKAAQALGASVTPEAFLLDSSGEGGLQGRHCWVAESDRERGSETTGSRRVHHSIRNADRQTRPSTAVRGSIWQYRLLVRADLQPHPRRTGPPRFQHCGSVQWRPACDLVRRQLRVVGRRGAVHGAQEKRPANLGERRRCCCGNPVLQSAMQ